MLEKNNNNNNNNSNNSNNSKYDLKARTFQGNHQWGDMW